MSEFSTVSRETVENCVTFQRKGKESCLNGRNLPERSTPCLWKASAPRRFRLGQFLMKRSWRGWLRASGKTVCSSRKVEGGYELVAGERRLRACKLARMETIPAILCDCGDQRTAALGLLENIQREDLNPFEQAQGLRDVIALWDCTQAEAAKRLGMAQPTLANKLRLLQLTTDQRQFVLDNGLTERHARAVLRLPENRRSEALITIAKRRMNARQTDLYIEQVLNAAAPGRHRISMVKDVRIFVNTIDHAIRLMTDNGVPATAHREERDGYIEYTVRIPTAAAQR